MCLTGQYGYGDVTRLNAVVACILVAGLLLWAADFVGRVHDFEHLDAELRHKWGVSSHKSDAPGAGIPLWVGEFGKGLRCLIRQD